MAEEKIPCPENFRHVAQPGQVICPNYKCNGAGGWSGISGGVPTWETCGVCWGKGTVDCPTCKGYGYVYRYV